MISSPNKRVVDIACSMVSNFKPSPASNIPTSQFVTHAAPFVKLAWEHLQTEVWGFEAGAVVRGPL
jgi:hypothetical protein